MNAAAASAAPARVLYVVDGLGLSGKTKAMVDLVLGLDPARYTPTVACFDTEQSPLHQRLRAADVPVEVIPCPDGLNVQTPLRLAAVMRRLRPQIVHCYNPRTMLYAAGPARALGIRGTLGTLSAFACLTPDMDFRFLPQKLFSVSRKNRARNALVSRLVRALVAVSPSLGQRFCRFNYVDLARLRVIGYGVDLDRFTRVPAADVAAFRARHGVAPGAVLVSSVGRLVEQKDYPTQLRAFALAVQRVGAAADLVMLLAGDGPLRAELEALAASLGIAGRVRFVGHTPEIPLILRASDVYVLASKFEPYGVAVLEAKAAGVAILATSVNELPEIIADGESGCLVPPEDPQAMGEALAALATDGEQRRRLGRRAAEDAASRHSLRAAIDGYQRLYDEIREGH